MGEKGLSNPPQSPIEVNAKKEVGTVHPDVIAEQRGTEAALANQIDHEISEKIIRKAREGRENSGNLF